MDEELGPCPARADAASDLCSAVRVIVAGTERSDEFGIYTDLHITSFMFMRFVTSDRVNHATGQVSVYSLL